MSSGVPVTVEAVESSTQLRRFREIPYVLHHDVPQWRPPARAFDQWRLDSRRHPYFERGDGAFFLARRGGRPVGRIAAHHGTGDDRSDGRFGFFDAADDPAVVDALVGAAIEWLGEVGCPTMWGPVSWTPEEEFGVRVRGHDLPAMTGLPWQPGWSAVQLRRAGGVAGARREYWLRAPEAAPDGDPPTPAGAPLPPHAGRYGDPALVLDGIAAVPDVSELLAGATLRSAWSAARSARTRSFRRAVCVRCDGDPAVHVPRLLAAAGVAGYEEVAVPWGAGRDPAAVVTQVFAFG